MITVEAYYFYLLLLSNAVLLAIACYSVVRIERRCKKVEAFWASPTATAIAANSDDENEQQMQMTERLEQRVGELQRTVKVMEIARSKPVPAPPPERNLPIENAARMARLGASIDDLTRSCGLNIGEARLMQKLHGKAQIAASGM